MNEFKYTGKPKMTHEEFDYKHSEIIEWYKLWERLFWVGVVFFVISLFIGNFMLSTGIIIGQSVFIAFEFICKWQHGKLHDKWEEQHGEQR